MSKTTIEWTDETDNPIVVVDEEGKQAGWYCQKVSPGCQNCYAERLNGSSFYGGNKLPYKVLPDGKLPKLGLKQSVLDGWQRKTPNGRLVKHFVGSMTDLFADFVPAEWVFQILDAMRTARRRIFQLLTKRPRRMRELVTIWLERHALSEVPPHIWLGVSIEDQKRCDERMPEVALFPPAVVFLSCEPLLGDIDLNLGHHPGVVHWVIVGGESGSNARPMHPRWPLELHNQCHFWGVPFFFKQWGEYVPINVLPMPASKARFLRGLRRDGTALKRGDSVLEADVWVWKAGKKAAGRLLIGQTYDAFPLLEGLIIP